MQLIFFNARYKNLTQLKTFNCVKNFNAGGKILTLPIVFCDGTQLLVSNTSTSVCDWLFNLQSRQSVFIYVFMIYIRII